jgi:ATP-dependent 26S proteasome regulatory subunit
MHHELSGKYDAELKESLKRCILTRKPEINFKDIAGNAYAKEIINQSFVLPDLCPKLFQGSKAHPWQSILLYGPPGVGKTMLA